MNYLILIFICLFVIEGAMGQSPQFLKSILNPVKRPNTYLIVNIQSKGFNGEVVTENDFLFFVLSKQNRLARQTYEEFMLKILLNGKKLQLKRITLTKNRLFLKVSGINSLSFMALKDVPNVNQIAEKGCQEFIKHYFDEHLLLKGRISLEERNAVINRLFKWGIPSQLGDMQATVFLSENEVVCPT